MIGPNPRGGVYYYYTRTRDTRTRTTAPIKTCTHIENDRKRLTFALDFAVAYVSGLAFAQEMRRQVTALGVLDASTDDGRILAFVDIYI